MRLDNNPRQRRDREIHKHDTAHRHRVGHRYNHRVHALPGGNYSDDDVLLHYRYSLHNLGRCLEHLHRHGHHWLLADIRDDYDKKRHGTHNLHSSSTSINNSWHCGCRQPCLHHNHFLLWPGYNFDNHPCYLYRRTKHRDYRHSCPRHECAHCNKSSCLGDHPQYRCIKHCKPNSAGYPHSINRPSGCSTKHLQQSGIGLGRVSQHFRRLVKTWSEQRSPRIRQLLTRGTFCALQLGQSSC
jgi:hypothetical protein